MLKEGGVGGREEVNETLAQRGREEGEDPGNSLKQQQSFPSLGANNWIIAPLWLNGRDSCPSDDSIMLDFNNTICCVLFGQQAHRRLFRAFRQHKGFVKLSMLGFNAGMVANCLTLIVNDRFVGTILAIVVVVGPIPAHVQVLLTMNSTLMRLTLKSSYFWFIAILLVMLWTVVGLMVGGVRGILLAGGTITSAVLCGAMRDSYHYLLQSRALHMWSYVLVNLVYVNLAICVVVKSFLGGAVLRWPLGTRQLTGEDIVLNLAGTLLVYYMMPMIRTAVNLRRDSRRKPSAGTNRTRRVDCVMLSWPAVIWEEQQLGPSSSPAHQETACCGGNPSTGMLQHPTAADRELANHVHAIVPLDLTVLSEASVEIGQKSVFRKVIGRIRTTRQSSGSDKKGPQETTQSLLSITQVVVLRALVLIGVASIPLLLYLREFMEGDGRRPMAFLTSWRLGVVGLLWNCAFVVYLTNFWNYQLLCIILRSSFDFWFLMFQTLGLLLSLCDAYEYDERCLSLIAWCLLYAACLCSDSLVRSHCQQDVGRRHFITKRFLGWAVLAPLLLTQSWFLYDLFFRDGTNRLRFRVALRTTKYLEGFVTTLAQEGGGNGGHGAESPSALDLTTDSFVIGRVTSIILFSLPFLYHLLTGATTHLQQHNKAMPATTVNRGGSHYVSPAAALSSRTTSVVMNEAPLLKGSQKKKVLLGEGFLFFLTAQASYQIPYVKRQQRKKVAVDDQELRGGTTTAFRNERVDRSAEVQGPDLNIINQ